MAEIRLICPGCAAEYRVPDAAIPPGGREVECSACGHVWHAARQPGAIGPDPQPAAEPPTGGVPRLNRSLPDNVLDILRGEVEHERRARAAEGAGTRPAPAATPPAPTPDEDPPVAATSRPVRPEKTGPGERGTTEAETAEPQPAMPAPVGPQAAQPAPRTPGLAQLVPAQAAAVVAPIRKPAIREDRRDRPAPAAQPARSAYGMGFGLALILAAGLVALYLLAPRLADQGALGAVLTNLRDILDGARLWLQDSLGNLVG